MWDDAAREALPGWLWAWLILLVGQALVGGGYFSIRYQAPRILVGGILLSHLAVYTAMFLEIGVVTKGLVSLSHLLFWTPGLYLVAMDLRKSHSDPYYRLWSLVLLGTMAIAFLFDIRDALTYLFYTFF